MAATTFHLFPLLPYELRREIYLLAITPRYVEVKEHAEPFADFKDRFLTIPADVKAHPSIAYFAPLWARRIHTHAWIPRSEPVQASLEQFGFTCSKPQQPWEVTEHVPALPLHKLHADLPVAWELLRESHLYSKAPIPGLLHACHESRELMIKYGYELTFRTRSSGPRTWFSYKDDTLYLGKGIGEPRRLLAAEHGKWNVGQFEPDDLRRVQRLAVKLESRPRVEHDNMNNEMAKLLCLFPGVRTVDLVQWDQASLREVKSAEEAQAHRNQGTEEELVETNLGSSASNPATTLSEDPTSTDVATAPGDTVNPLSYRRPWIPVAVEPYDAFATLFSDYFDGIGLSIADAGATCYRLRWQLEHDRRDVATYLKYYARRKRWRVRVVRRSMMKAAGVVRRPRMPQFQAVHVMTPSMLERVEQARETFRRALEEDDSRSAIRASTEREVEKTWEEAQAEGLSNMEWQSRKYWLRERVWWLSRPMPPWMVFSGYATVGLGTN